MAGSEERQAQRAPLNGDRERTETKRGKSRGDAGVVESASYGGSADSGERGADGNVRPRERTL